ncbi:MAG: HAMP domain-containing histidine kinase [Clostridia bacterium]|nr:HAMP domain-containing histidine kinase [Clostridia bacterium]
MYKSVFKKYLTVLTLVVVIGFLSMTLLQAFLATGVLAEEKRQLLQENAQNIAHHTAMSASAVPTKDGSILYRVDPVALSPLLNTLADALDATAMLTDSHGQVLLLSRSPHGIRVGDVVNANLLSRVGESYYEVGTLGGLFDRPQYVAGVAVRVNDMTLGYVFMSTSTSNMMQILGANLRVYLISVAGALLISFCVLWLFTYRFVRPLKQMAAATRRFAQGDFSARLQVKGRDEVAELADALNHMAVSLSSVETMRRSFVANVSHELKTPMTTIAGFVDGILDGTVPPQKQSYYLKIVSDEVKRLSRLVRSMLDLSRIDSGELKMTRVRLDLTEAMCSVLVSSEPRIEGKRLTISGMEDAEKTEIDGDYDLMSQVLYNLLDNAIKFTNEGGDIDIRMRSQDGRVYVTVRNTGAGIPAEELPQIFERYYKSDRSRSLDKNGLGLGLYIVQTVIRLHGGEITVRSVEGEFTEFSFWVPAAGTCS